MNSIFKIVAGILLYIEKKTRLTYNEINIIVYYFLIPLSWLVLLDIILGVHYLKIAFVVYCLGFMVGCRNFKNYSNWLFTKSVTFLNYFNKYGSNYIKSSVWICVWLPLVVYIILLYLILEVSIDVEHGYLVYIDSIKKSQILKYMKTLKSSIHYCKKLINQKNA